MGQITVFQPTFLGSKFFFSIFSPRTPLWVITRCPMSFGGGLELKNPKFERICEVGVDFAFQRADFDKIETLTLMQCIWGIFIEKYQVLYHFGFVRSLPSRCHGSWIPPLPYLSTVHSFVSSSGNVTCRVRGPISFWPPRWISVFFSFSRPNIPQYWKLIEFWLEFGFSDVFLSFFVKFWHFRHISIHKMVSKS